MTDRSHHCQKCDGVLDLREFNRGICDECHKETPQLIEEIVKQATEAALKMSPAEKAKVRQQLDMETPRPCGGCSIPTLSRNQLCDVCDSLYAALTRTPAACKYWKQVEAEARHEAQRIKYMCGMDRDPDEASQ